MTGRDLIAGLYEAFGRGDVPGVLGLMDPQIHWHEAESNPYMPSGEAWIGPDAIVNNLFMKLAGDWEDFAVHPGTYHDAGGSVVVEGRYKGTNSATGKPMDAQFCHVWTIEDGKITKFQQYVDTAQFRGAMGL